jgi:hypothetical protein
MLKMLQEKTVEEWELQGLQAQTNCLECSEFEANHFIKRGVCRNRGCYTTIQSCDECFEFHRFYLVKKQECKMCNFHVHEHFIESLRRFGINAGSFDLAKLQERCSILQREMRPRRLSVRACPACPAKKQCVDARDAAGRLKQTQVPERCRPATAPQDSDAL